jgi:hypothetical protein
MAGRRAFFSTIRIVSFLLVCVGALVINYGILGQSSTSPDSIHTSVVHLTWGGPRYLEAGQLKLYNGLLWLTLGAAFLFVLSHFMMLLKK